MDVAAKATGKYSRRPHQDDPHSQTTVKYYRAPLINSYAAFICCVFSVAI